MERTVAVLSDVKDLGELLEGARVDRVRCVPSGLRLQVECDFTRTCPERQPVGRRGIFTKAKSSFAQSRLSLQHVKDMTLRSKSEMTKESLGPLLSCEAVPGGYTFTVTNVQGMQLSLALEQLSGQFADIGKPIEPS